MIIKENKDEFQSYLEDTSNLKGDADILYIPDTDEEIQDILAQCQRKKVPLTCSAGRTGTTGGCVPFQGAILSLERLNRIIDIDSGTFSAFIQPGATLEELSGELKKFGFTLRAQPTESLAFIGGAVSTAASGVRGFKYGGIRDYVQSLKIILPEGILLEVKRGEVFARGRMFDFEKSGKRFKFPLPTYIMPSVKHQAGYYVKDNMDLIDLFIGSEGTLGVITEVQLLLQRLSPYIFDCVVFFKNEEDALGFADTVKELKEKGKVDPVSLEFFDARSLDFLKSPYPQLTQSGAAVYFEQETEKDSSQVIDVWLKIIERSGASSEETWFGDSEHERKKIYEFRHALPKAIIEFLKEHHQRKISNDISVPGEAFKEMYRYYEQGGKQSKIPYVNFGHIGENHLHFNFLPRTDEEAKKAGVWSIEFIKKAVSLGGTVSAEHGIGKLKKPYLLFMYGPDHIHEMAQVKQYFDSDFLIGRDNIIDRESLKKQWGTR